MDWTDPGTVTTGGLLVVLSGVILAGFIRGSKGAGSVKTPFFTYEKKDDSERATLERTVLELRAEVRTLRKSYQAQEIKDWEMEARIYLLEHIERDKAEFRRKVYEAAKRTVGAIAGSYERHLVEALKIPEDLVPRFDEYHDFDHRLELMRHQIVRRALDDWDANGFHKLDLDPVTGRPDAGRLLAYYQGKASDYRHDVKGILLDGLTLMPVSMVKDGEGRKLIQNPRAVQPSDVKAIIERHLPEIERWVHDIYEDAIAGAKVRKAKYDEIKRGAK